MREKREREKKKPEFSFKSDHDEIFLNILLTGDKWHKLTGNLQSGKKQAGWVKYINSSSVTVEVQHFSLFRISRLFEKPLKRTLVMYMTPGIITQATAMVYVTAYTIQEKLSKVRVI